MRYIFARINNDIFASEIAKGVDILQRTRLALKQPRTALQNVVLLSKQVKMKMT